jgi:hypothetical protein
MSRNATGWARVKKRAWPFLAGEVMIFTVGFLARVPAPA